MRTKQLLLLPLLALAALIDAQAQSITVYPGPAAIPKATSRQMSAYVPLSPNTVTWAVNGAIGGGATYGTVSPTGFYTAPAVIPPANLITIQVTSSASPSNFGTAQISITQPLLYIWGLSASKFAVGPFSFDVNGAGFVPGTVITINGQAMATTYLTATSLKVSDVIPVAMIGTAAVRALSPGPGSTTSDPVSITISNSTVNVSVNPSSAALPINGTQAFAATVTGTVNLGVTWSASVGTISSAGQYTAPSVLPNPATATVKATSIADQLVFATAVITLSLPSVTVTVTPPSSQVLLNGTQQFTAAAVGNANTGVNWAVNGVSGGNGTVGTISAAGLYTAPTNLPSPSTVTVRAASAAVPSVFSQASVSLKLTPPPMPNLTHARFLEQAAFGPTAVELTNVGTQGIDGWLAQQFTMAETAIPIPASTSLAESQHTSRLVHSPDQLRQRVIHALSKIIVVSANKNAYADELVPWIQILSKNAFGNYRQLLWDITVSPQMGKYLDLANSSKATPTSNPNENYPREVMQLFTTGLVMLNPDGTPQLDGQGKTIPTYDQTTIAQTARALTGWTYPTPVGGAMGVQNWESFNAPAMEARDQYHDKTAKTLIGGCPIPAGLTVQVETNMVLDCLFNHPNTAIFISLRLIRDLVTSNPSGEYVQRVVDVWNNNGAGAKGDLKAVINAILTDAEARQDQATPQQGRLKDPVYAIVEFVRSMNGLLAPDNIHGWDFFLMGQKELHAPSVFGHYSLMYRIQGVSLAAPEFHIYSPTESVLRGNFIYGMLTNPNQTDLKINLSPFQAVAADPTALIEQVNATLLFGRMTQAMKDSLAVALASASDNNQRIVTALYLTALSGYYTVQY